MTILLRFLLLFMIATSTWAGNGSSGGGHIYGDKLNPWFVQNTSSVTYCVEVAPGFGQLGSERIVELIDNAFKFWKKTFENYSSQMQGDLWVKGFKFQVGTQEFLYQKECSEETDLKFQMGSLTDEQAKRLNYKQIIGLAERTSYDPRTLRGRGFIYIAPETGEFRPASPKLHPAPWSTGKNLALQYLLYHEVGHIFGLQDGFNEDSVLMWAHYAEFVSSEETVRELSNTLPWTPMPLGCNKNLEGDYTSSGTNHSNKLAHFLGLYNKEKTFQFTSSKSGLVIEDALNQRVIGSIQYRRSFASEEGNVAVSIYLTKDQTLFPNLPEEFYDNHQPLYYQVVSKVFKNEVLSLANGNSLKVFVQFNSSCWPTVGGSFEDEFYFDLFSGY